MVAVTAMVCHADLIITKSGQTITAYNIEVGPKSIFYTTEANPDSQLQKINNDEVFGYKIGDGEMQTPGSNATPAPAPAAQDPAPAIQSDYTVATANANNAALKAKYTAGQYSIKKAKKTDKVAKAAMIFYKLTDNSVISTPEIEVNFELGRIYDKAWARGIDIAYSKDRRRYLIGASDCQLKIDIKNKTDKPIYLDLAETIVNNDLHGYRAYYDGSQTVEGGGTSGSVGIGLFGIGFGSGASNNSSVMKGQPNVMLIAPKATVTLPFYGEYSDFDNKVIYYYDRVGFDKPSTLALKYSMNVGDEIQYTEEDSPTKISYTLTYSDTSSMEHKKTVGFTFYVCQANGLKNLFNPMALTPQAYDELKNIENFDENTIVGAILLK